ncbi:MAG: hypothetical protein AAF356_10460 [Planctomycetota bacterium]
MRFRTTAIALLSVSCTLLSACGGQRIKGRVIEGGIGRAMVVSATDTRTIATAGVDDPAGDAQTGFEGVRVRLLRPSGRTTGGPAAEIASAVSGPDGFFDISVGNKDQISGRFEIEASGGGVFQVRNTIFVPRNDQRVLVLVRPNSAAE